VNDPLPHDGSDELCLDPEDWEDFRDTAHAALDDAINFLKTVRERPVWQPVPPQVRASLDRPLPVDPTPLREVYQDFTESILPYATGNVHPRFFGWVHGAGLAGGIVSEALAAAMNANCGGRDHGAVYVERTVISWCRQIFGFPHDASGLLVSGTSMANFIGVCVARHALNEDIRRKGVNSHAGAPVAYASSEAHESISRALEILGLGAAALRKVPVKPDFTIDTETLRRLVAEDRQSGLQPFLVAGSAGTVNTGAIDPLDDLASFCAAEKLWFHVDGAFGALAILSDAHRHRLRGIDRADSLAFDFHKWAQVPYDCGCILVRRADLHRGAFSMRQPSNSQPTYLAGMDRGLAGGGDWACEFGPELSRSFRALKVWFALREHGTRNIGRLVAQNCAQAEHLAQRIAREPDLQLLTPVSLNIVCFRFAPPELQAAAGSAPLLDRLNQEIVADIQEAGIAAPSTARIRGSLAIRANITNHRSRRGDLDILADAVLSAGRKRLGHSTVSAPAGSV
jgi:aromatic-L-amino-acid decarboxylase